MHLKNQPTIQQLNIWYYNKKKKDRNQYKVTNKNGTRSPKQMIAIQANG